MVFFIYFQAFVSTVWFHIFQIHNTLNECFFLMSMKEC